MNRVVPVAVEVVPLQVNLVHLLGTDRDALRIRALIDFGSDAQSSRGRRRAYETDNRGQTRQRFAAPVHGDIREEPVLDLVPLARTRRIVTHRDRQAGALGELLQFPLPQPRLSAIAAATVGGDQQVRCVRVGRASHLLPPAADGVRREAGGVMIDADADPALVPGQVVDPVGDGLALLRDDEVMDAHTLRGPFRVPLAAGFLKSPTNSFFLVSTEMAG